MQALVCQHSGLRGWDQSQEHEPLVNQYENLKVAMVFNMG